MRGKVRHGLHYPLQRATPTNTVVSANGADSFNCWQRKIVRTSDGTIHTLIQRTGAITHYYSRNDGHSWESVDVYDSSQNCAIDKDSNGNLIAVWVDGLGNVLFKKASVDKTNPNQWTWTWGSEKTVCYFASSPPRRVDVLVDNYDYYHVVFDRTGSYNSGWSRCIDGSGDSWTVTTNIVWGIRTFSIVKDSLNNLFIIGSLATGSANIRGVKITYSPGPSWSVGSDTLIYDGYELSAQPCIAVLPDDRIIMLWIYNPATYTLYFRKTTNPSDITAWESVAAVESSATATASSQSLMVISSPVIRAYYIYNDAVVYKESTDGGLTWGDRQNVYTVGTNRATNIAKTTIGKIDIIWRNGTADPYKIFHSYYLT